VQLVELAFVPQVVGAFPHEGCHFGLGRANSRESCLLLTAVNNRVLVFESLHSFLMESELEKTVVLDTATTTLPTLETTRRAATTLGELLPNGEISLRRARLKQVPKELLEDRWDRVLHFDLRENEISSLDCSPVLGLLQLRTLDLRSNRVEFLPEEIAGLVRLKVLRADENLISYLPRALWTLEALEALTLGKNSLFALPGEVGKLTRLKTLVLCENRILSLPTELGELKHLQALSIHGNEFSSLPTSFCDLTQLKEISLEWFRYTLPPLPKVLKSSIGQKMISSLCSLTSDLRRQNIQYCTLLVFLMHFSGQEMSGITISKSKKSLMHMAAQEGDCGVVKGLLESGMGLNTLDGEDFSPVALALREDKMNCAKLLLDQGADVRGGAGHFGTPLHLAVLKQEPWLVRDLLKRGALASARDREGNTALHLAMVFFSSSPRKGLIIADMLLNAGVEVNARNEDENTALHLAVRTGHVDAVKWVLLMNRKLARMRKEPFDLNTKGKAGLTALHIATNAGFYEIMRLLIEVGKVNLLLRSSDGLTPKQVAKKDLTLLKYLILAEKEAYFDLSHRTQHIEVRDEDAQPDLPQAANVLDPTASLSERYSALYALFSLRKNDDLREIAASLDSSSPLLPDVLYLLGQLNDSRALPIFERFGQEVALQSSLVRDESLNSVDLIRGASTQTLAMRVIMGPKLQRSEQILRGCLSVRNLTTFSKEHKRSLRPS